MEDQTTQPPAVPPIPVETPVQPVPIVPSLKSNWLISILFLVTGIAIGAAGLWIYQNYQFEANQVGYPSPSPTSDPTADWETYTISSLAVSFRLPPTFQYNDFSEQIYNGDTGTKSCSTFNLESDLVGICNINIFGVGTVSADYSAGRGGVFTDLLGYEKIDDKYHAKSVITLFEIPASLIISEMTNPNGVQILLVRGADGTGPLGGLEPGTPGEGNLGAFVNNPNNSTYPGFVVQMELVENLDLNTFDQILSTIEFTE